MTVTQLTIAAVIVPVITVTAVAAARWLGRWLGRAVRDSMTDVVTTIVAPHLAGVTRSVDELRQWNTAEHTEGQRRLALIETQLGELALRVGSLESHVATPQNTTVHVHQSEERHAP